MGIASSLDAKTIDELQELGKLTGTEKTIVSDGIESRKVSIDTIVGYTARNILNSGTASAKISIPSSSYSGNLVFIPEGETIDVTERTPGCFYLEETKQTSIRTKVNMPTSVVVSKTLGLRRI